MDYSKNIKASWEADLAYAKWYEQQPNEQKAKMIESSYKMVVNHIRIQVLENNPFATCYDIMLQFVKHTQKEDYPPETYSFIEQNIKEYSEKEWKKRFKVMKKQLGWSYDDIARFIGASNGASVKASINRKLPAFAKLAVCVFEQNQSPSNPLLDQ